LKHYTGGFGMQKGEKGRNGDKKRLRGEIETRRKKRPD
jgi:hypothetical protein